jgi:hypothetical protein
MNKMSFPTIPLILSRNTTIASMLIIQVVVIVAKLLNAWYTQSMEGINAILWAVADPPWQANGTLYQIKPLWGVHYFGDLQDLLTSAAWANPWGVSPTQHPPVGINLVSLFGVFGQSWTAPLFIAISLFSSIFLVHCWTADETFAMRVLYWLTLVPLNMTALLVLDRGNLLLIAIPLMGIAMFHLTKKFEASPFTLILIATAISLKTFLALPLIITFVIGSNRWNTIFKLFLTTLLLNLFVMFSYSGSTIGNFSTFIKTTLNFASQEPAETALRTGSSLYRLTLESIANRSFADVFLSSLGVISFFIWMSLVSIVLVMRAIPVWIKLVVSFSSVQMAITGSPYILIWSIIAVLAIPREIHVESKETDKSLRGRYAEVIMAILISFATLVGNLPISNRLLLSATLWTVVLLSAIVLYLPNPLSKKEKFALLAQVNH